MKKIIKNAIGVDESQKMQIIGELPICGVYLEHSRMLSGLGIKDSKCLSKKRIQELAPIIKSKTKSYLHLISPQDISKFNINDLECQRISWVLKSAEEDGLKIENVIVDNFDYTREKFLARMSKYFDINKYNWIVEHDADKKYRAVSAASIIAKFVGDALIDIYNDKYGIGSGNPGDKRTENFIKSKINELEKWGWLIRLKWKTINRLKEEVKLDEQTRTNIICG